MSTHGPIVTAALACALLAGPARGDVGDPLTANLADLSLEQLGDIEVTSVSRRAERLSDAAASIYVIRSDDIRRSGAKTLPEALRLAPTLQVARADANQYAISARGFNSVFANKMLVLIDGRTVYSPLFSGVFWEAQDLVLDDVDRIEVITGPGGTLWGTNAVNGVINVITREAGRTQGVRANAGAGNDLRVGEASYGGRTGATLRYRGWIKASKQEHSESETGADIVDESERVHGGFRADWSRFMLQGGASSARIDQLPSERKLSAFHLLGRWTKQASPTGNLSVQAYWDRTNRDQPSAIRDALDTFDFELQHAFRPAARHDLFWGAGYRYQSDRLTNLDPVTFRFIPDDRILRIGYAFLEDGVRLADDLHLILGLKAEHNVYTHWEYLPSARLAWKPASEQLLWAAWSRAVRAPARVDRELYAPGSPPFLVIEGGPNFVSEVSSVTELGYRAQPAKALSFSVTGFVHDHDRLRTLETQAPPTGPQLENGIHARTWGAEAWARVRVNERWRLNGGLVEHRRIAALDPGSTDVNGLAMLGDDPRYWWSLGTSVDLGSRLECDALLRQVGALPTVPRYTTIDARIGARLVHGFELSIAGRNLLEPEHVEWGTRDTFDRAYFVQLSWHGLADGENR